MADPLGQLLNNIGGLYVEMRDRDRAGPVLRQAVEHMRATHCDRYPHFATAVLNLGLWHERVRQFPEALRLIRECVRIWEDVLGTDHRRDAGVPRCRGSGSRLCPGRRATR